MKVVKTWAHIHFQSGDEDIEVALNYQTKMFNLSSPNEDQSVSFKSEDSTLDECLERAKCVVAALNYLKKEL